METVTLMSQSPAITTATETSWLTSFEHWLLSFPTKKKETRNPKTISSYLGDVRQFERYFEEVNHSPFDLSQLNSIDLENYFSELAQSAKPSTHKRKLASLRMLIRYAKERGLIDYDPTEWIPQVQTTRSSPVDINDDELHMLEVASDSIEIELDGMRKSVIFYLMSNAGLRIREVVGLTISDLDLKDGIIHVLGKGKKHRYVKIGGKLIEKIESWMDVKPASAEDALIVKENGTSISTDTARRDFYAIRAEAGVSEKITPHSMRHTFVYRSMKNYMGEDPWKWHAALDFVCQQTGDDPAVILSYYNHARESDMRAAVEKM